jgi:hypothetical protein
MRDLFDSSDRVTRVLNQTARVVGLVVVLALALTMAGNSRAEMVQPGVDTTLDTQTPPNAQSTTGPTPPAGVMAEIVDLGAADVASTTISGVPAYDWRHGCGPTAAGMAIGYWDGQGYGALVPGDASTQTAAVNTMIASGNTHVVTGTHYSDYAYPEDYYPNLQLDLSEPPPGDEPADQCVADYMKTSQSAYGNYYGWSWFMHIGIALQGYTRQALGGDYYGITEDLYMLWDGSLNWDSLRTEIDAGRPMVFLVDTDADGSTDHFVTVIGYAETGGVQYYACHNTWDLNVHWYEFAPLAQGQYWGVFGATTYRIVEVNQHLYLPHIEGGVGAVGVAR